MSNPKIAHFTLLRKKRTLINGDILLVGGSGFIGQAVNERLATLGIHSFAPTRYQLNTDLNSTYQTVIFCAGKTFQKSLGIEDYWASDTALLAKTIEVTRPRKLIYLSSTRVYQGFQGGFAREDLDLVRFARLDAFNTSRLAAENFCRNANIPEVIILRVSNVIGFNLFSNNFFYSILRAAIQTGHISLESSLNAARDYISLEDVLDIVVEVLRSSAKGTFNLSYGKNIANSDLINLIKSVTRLDISVDVNSENQIHKQPVITNAKLSKQFSFTPRKPEIFLTNSIQLLHAFHTHQL